MPNSWSHFHPNPDTSCIAPLVAPYGRWNIDEIIYAAFPMFCIITIWRALFCYIFSPFLGGYISHREYPDPHPMPSFLSTETSKLKLRKLNKFYNKIKRKKSKVPKRKKTAESTHKKTDLYLTQSIKRRNEGHKHKKHKPLILPKGLSPNQSRDNLAFLASLDSDTTRVEIPIIMNDLDYSLSQIREYCHYKKDYDNIRTLTRKFNEEAWKAVTMFFGTMYGIWVMSQEGFFSDPHLLYKEWPQIESWRVFLYYQIATGYHAHRAIWQFWEKQRKDAVAMFIHHWVTVCLISSSWYWGLMNIGSVVMVLHDNADVFLPSAKLARWLQWNMMKNICFIFFMVCWIASRIWLFSWKVLIPAFTYGWSAYSCHHYKFVWFVGLLLILLCLHLYWTFDILRAAFGWLCFAESIEDTRSDTEDTEEIVIHPEEFCESDDDINDDIQDNSNKKA